MPWFKNYQPRTVDLLSFLYTVGYFSVLGMAFFRPFPPENKDALLLLLGILSMVMAKIVEGYFNKDAINSATTSTIRAIQNGHNPDSPIKPIDIKGDQK